MKNPFARKTAVSPSETATAAPTPTDPRLAMVAALADEDLSSFSGLLSEHPWLATQALGASIDPARSAPLLFEVLCMRGWQDGMVAFMVRHRAPLICGPTERLAPDTALTLAATHGFPFLHALHAHAPALLLDGLRRALREQEAAILARLPREADRDLARLWINTLVVVPVPTSMPAPPSRPHWAGGGGGGGGVKA